MQNDQNQTLNQTEDPLIVLLRRYEAGMKTFNETPAIERNDEYWDNLAKETWYDAQQEIIRTKPSATTAAGAVMALDHVLKSEELFGELSSFADLQMLWQVLKAAREYVASLE